MTIRNKFMKSALLLTGITFMASNAFCAGTVTGSVDTAVPKYKKDVVVYLKGVKGPFAAPASTAWSIRKIWYLYRMSLPYLPELLLICQQ